MKIGKVDRAPAEQEGTPACFGCGEEHRKREMYFVEIEGEVPKRWICAGCFDSAEKLEQAIEPEKIESEESVGEPGAGTDE